MLRSLRPCRYTTCTELTRDASGYCTDHEYIAQENHMKYKKSRTDKKEQSFYCSGNWIKLRTVVLGRDHGLCQHCLAEGKVTLVDVIHHIIPIKRDWSKRLDINNLICLCNSCHQQIHKNNR